MENRSIAEEFGTLNGRVLISLDFSSAAKRDLQHFLSPKSIPVIFPEFRNLAAEFPFDHGPIHAETDAGRVHGAVPAESESALHVPLQRKLTRDVHVLRQIMDRNEHPFRTAGEDLMNGGVFCGVFSLREHLREERDIRAFETLRTIVRCNVHRGVR